MGWNYLDFDIANHEAAHSVVAVLAQLPVKSVTIDGPLVHNGWDADGITRVGTVASRRGLKRKLAATLAPSIAERQPIQYPPRRDTVGDEMVCAVVVDVLGLSRGEWNLVVHGTEEMLALQGPRCAIAAVSSALLQKGALTGDEIRELTERETGATYEVGTSRERAWRDAFVDPVRDVHSPRD